MTDSVRSRGSEEPCARRPARCSKTRGDLVLRSAAEALPSRTPALSTAGTDRGFGVVAGGPAVPRSSLPSASMLLFGFVLLAVFVISLWYTSARTEGASLAVRLASARSRCPCFAAELGWFFFSEFGRHPGSSTALGGGGGSDLPRDPSVTRRSTIWCCHLDSTAVYAVSP